MRNSRYVVLVLVLLMAAAGLAAIAGEEKVAVQSTHGEVTAVETDAATITVKPDEGESLTFHVDDHTKIVRGGQEAGLEDISAGELVTVKYKKEDNGRYVAVSVGIG